MYTLKTILFVAAIGLINYSFLTTNTKLTTSTNTFNTNQLEKLNAFSQELNTVYHSGENVVLLDKSGKEYLNPTKADLLKLSPELFNENRVRVTLHGRSDNDLCSSEIVVMDKSGKLEANYTVNACSSYGWIFFSKSNCFDIALFHDAGLEAPFGSSVHGSIDWTFQFNQMTRVTGTYTDMGAANMFKVASPCYDKKSMNIDVVTASKTIRKGNLGL